MPFLRGGITGVAGKDSPFWSAPWLLNKLSQSIAAVKLLEAQHGKHGKHGKQTPLLVFSDVRVVDRDLKELFPSFWRRESIDPEAIHSQDCRYVFQNRARGTLHYLQGVGLMQYSPSAWGELDSSVHYKCTPLALRIAFSELWRRPQEECLQGVTGPLNEALTPSEAKQLAWRAESGTIQSYRHIETGQHLQPEGRTGQFYHQDRMRSGRKKR